MAWRYFFPVVGGYLTGQVPSGEVATGRWLEPMIGRVLGGLLGRLIFRRFGH